MRLFTIGFTQKSAEDFFTRLTKAGVRKIVDVRLSNVSQLAGFAKRDDLAYFCRQHKIEYIHEPDLAPTKDILDGYKKEKGEWGDYEKKFLKLMRARQIEKMKRAGLNDSCLLCSEDKPHHCHRRLVAEYWNTHWKDVDINHL